jgi:serine/threonine-protein kinase
MPSTISVVRPTDAHRHGAGLPSVFGYNALRVRSFGKYRLVEHLASGGMADVWRAEMPGPQGFVKEVALKLVRGEHRGDDAFVRMFVREARLASRLSHANVVQVFDFDQIDGQHYLAMELVRGRTLRAVLDRCRELGLRFGLPRAVHVGAEVARALAYAHRLEDGGRPAGLVHRDVSPQNVLVSFEGEVKLADFGIALAAGAAEHTRSGTVKGKLAYMAPEQARGEPVDARADVFALGVVLWEACTGRRLFARDGDAATLAALLGAEPVSPPSAWNEQVPPELDALVLAALERDPARRLASADELAQGLAALRLRLARGPEDLDLRALMRRLWPEGEGELRPGIEPTALRTPPEPTEPERAPPRSAGETRADLDPAEAPTRTAAPRRAPRRTWLAGAALGIVALAGAGWVAANGTGASTATPASQTGIQTSTSTGTGTGTGTATPTQTGTETPTAPAPVEPATLTVHAAPWASVHVDGTALGDTPVTVELAPGRHRVRAVHPRAGEVEEVLDLAPGERRLWRPRLSR